MNHNGRIGKTTKIILDPIAADDVYETDDSVVMPMVILRITEEVTPKDIRHTLGYIEKTKKGEMKKREPFSIVERGDGTYSVIDGNKSHSALKELRVKNVPVTVADRPYHKEDRTFLSSSSGTCSTDNPNRQVLCICSCVNMLPTSMFRVMKSKRSRRLSTESSRRSPRPESRRLSCWLRVLQKEQKTIQNIIAQQKKKDAALNAQIDRLIAEEVARQKARAEAEARRRAEAAARERELAEARVREEKARAEAKAAKDKKSREEAERRVREAEEKRVAAQRKAESMPMTPPSEDVRISGNFESNRGRLPMPITGAYRIVSHFGQYNVEGLHNVTLDNKGINIKGENGAQARSIFDGEVSGVFSFGGTMVVMVRHGSYISVYCNLASVNVHRGQRVSTRQALGRVGTDNILQFQLRKETAKLNPESWLGR